MAPTNDGVAIALAPPQAHSADRETARIKHSAIVATVAEMTGVPPTGRNALGANIKSLLGKGKRRRAGRHRAVPRQGDYAFQQMLKGRSTNGRL